MDLFKNVSHISVTVTDIEKTREFYSGVLGFKVSDSATNFLFARGPGRGREVFKALLKRGVIVRPLEEYGLVHHLRITIGTEKQNQQLVLALREVLGTAS